jgi:hypothetical protein
MTTIHVTKLECVRKQDVVGTDEAVIFLDNQEMGVWPMSKGQIRNFNPHLSKPFNGSVTVELKERNGLNKYTPLGSTMVNAANPGPQPVEFKTSGAHYHLWYHLI